jgi:hypothetical protein
VAVGLQAASKTLASTSILVCLIILVFIVDFISLVFLSEVI